MKKLIMAVAIVCAAVASQAAQISWGNATTSKMYGLDGSTALTTSLATTYALTVSLVDASGKTAASTSTFNGMNAGVLSVGGYTYTYDTDYTKGDTFTILAKMTVDGKAYEMEIGTYSITATADKDTESFAWAAGTYGGLSGTATAGTAGSWVAQSVPEPTSGLLLVLGMAGLALRRRRA